jgi:hypothetical protein
VVHRFLDTLPGTMHGPLICGVPSPRPALQVGGATPSEGGAPRERRLSGGGGDEAGGELAIADDAESQGETMDESDYKRGQRFKKLYAVLSGPLVRPCVWRLLAAVSLTSLACSSN